MTEQAIPQAPETALANSPVRMPASEPVKMATPKEETRSYHILALVTAYCPCSRCCGKFANGRTSTRTSAWNPGAASDPTVIPYGSMVEVPGYGRVKVDDTGVAMRNSWRKKGRIHLDVRFDYHYQARNWGSKLLTIKVTPPAKKK